jgi:hypothetical protein
MEDLPALTASCSTPLSLTLSLFSLITDYIDSINDRIVRKLEAVLESFSCQICLEQSKAVKETIITDYFRH